MTEIDALNRDFAKYDQVEKAHTYHLAEHESDEFDEDYEIATLDFEPFLRGDAADKARFADAWPSITNTCLSPLPRRWFKASAAIRTSTITSSPVPILGFA